MMDLKKCGGGKVLIKIVTFVNIMVTNQVKVESFYEKKQWKLLFFYLIITYSRKIIDVSNEVVNFKFTI